MSILDKYSILIILPILRQHKLLLGFVNMSQQKSDTKSEILKYADFVETLVILLRFRSWI